MKYRYLLWFELFTPLQRVKLWNSLVFSQNYFKYVAFNPKYQREDIKIMMSKSNHSKLIFSSILD